MDDLLMQHEREYIIERDRTRFRGYLLAWRPFEIFHDTAKDKSFVIEPQVVQGVYIWET